MNCPERIGDVACQRETGHVGPHISHGSAVIWADAASPLSLLIAHDPLWHMLAEIQRAGWSASECNYLRNIVEEQPDRTWGLERAKGRRPFTAPVQSDDDEVFARRLPFIDEES